MRLYIDVSAAMQQTAGVARYISRLTEHLLALGGEHQYTFFHSRIGPNSSSFRIPESVAERGLPLSNKQWRLLLLAAHGLGFSLDRWFPDVDLFHGTDHLIPPLRRSKLVLTVHDLSFLLLPQCHTRANRLNLRLMVPLCARRADAIIADSEATKRDLVRLMGVPAGKIRVVYLGVDGSYRPIDHREVLAAIRRKYGIKGNFLLHVGTLEPRKNLRTLAKALRRLDLRDHPLVCVGPVGWRKGELAPVLAEMGPVPVVFIGPVPEEDLPLLYNAATLFVYPSLYEGFGLPVLEAMACGTPVVCSNRGALPEVAGDAALLVEPTDPGPLAEAIQRALTDEALRRRLAHQGPQRAAAFSWDKAARETLEVYQQVCTDGNTGNPSRGRCHGG